MDFNPNLETESSKNSSVAGLQDGGVDTNIAGTSESKESLSIESEIDQSIETTKLKINNDNYIGTLQFGNNNIVETIIQDSKSEDSEKNYMCKFCFKVFDKHQALGGHMNGHSKDDWNLEKFGKVTTWIHATYPPPTLASEAELQGTPSNGATYNSYNHLIENANVYNQLGGHLTNQQTTQQIQSSKELQLQKLQYYQAQELQRYQYSQRLQSNQALESLQNTQVPQRLQNYQTPIGLQNYQTLQGLQNTQALQSPQNYKAPQASQGFQIYQTLQQFENYQTPQELEYYEALQQLQNYQASRGPQSYQTPQGSKSYQAPQRPQSYQNTQGSQSYQTQQGSKSYQAPQTPQSYQTPQGSKSYQAPHRLQSYQTPQGSKSYQAPHGQWQQLVDDANNQQNINLNSKTSNKPMSLNKVPSNEQKNNSSNFQGLHFQKEAQGPQRYMPNPDNLRNGDHLTTRIFINEKMNKEYYGESNVLKGSNQMISILPNCDAVAQWRPTNSQDTLNSCN